MTTTSTSNTVASVNLKRKLHWTISNRCHAMLTMFLKFSNKSTLHSLSKSAINRREIKMHNNYRNSNREEIME